MKNDCFLYDTSRRLIPAQVFSVIRFSLGAAFLLGVISTGLNAASPESAKPQLTGEEGLAKSAKDLSYSNDIVYKTVGGKNLEMILFRPLEKKYDKSPVLLYIHGGGWSGGDRYKMLAPAILPMLRLASRAGFTCVSIEYRLLNYRDKVTARECLVDCKDAIRFLAKEADRFGIDHERIALFGDSAGGHLILACGLSDDAKYPGDPGLAAYHGKVRALISYYGWTSFEVDDYFNGLLKGSGFEKPDRFLQLLNRMVGGPYEDDGGRAMAKLRPDELRTMLQTVQFQKKELIDAISPTRLLPGTGLPIFLAQGDADKAVAVAQAILMRDDCQKAGVPVECVISKNAAHGLAGKDTDPSIAQINAWTMDFLLKYVAPAP